MIRPAIKAQANGSKGERLKKYSLSEALSARRSSSNLNFRCIGSEAGIAMPLYLFSDLVLAVHVWLEGFWYVDRTVGVLIEFEDRDKYSR